ncbi:phage tail protein (plasmid) [Escherichia coli]|uniref:phage tail protein n=5 Tax=Bacteria TaxID=2 RepID=UPI000EF1367A|nr:tail fiber protein [Escherichia coli]AYL08074.1 phage tail protein [Escherichia coli]
MGADKTNNIMTLSSGVSQSLLADVQYFELYSSLALNRKLKNIVLPGFYCGFEPVPGTGLSVRITSENSEGKGAASVDVNNVQISVQQIEDVTVSVKAGATNIIVLEANFEHGVKTTQVDSASSVSAARIYARTDNTIGQNQIELCRVIVPSGATAVTKEMIVLKYRVNRAVGVEFSNEISSTEERKAATPKAVKAAYDLANGKYTAQDATTTQKGIVQLSSDTNSTSETLAATPKAVKAAYDLAAGKAPSNHIHPWNQITGVPTASLTAKGITQLSSATNSTSEVLAATPKAVKAAYDLANGKYTAQDATTTQKGIVQLSSDTNSTSETLAATPKAVKAAYDLAAGKAPSNHTHPWNQITGVPTASLTAKGITQLSSATNSTSEVLAATPKAVKAAYDLANGKQPEDATLTALAGLATAADRLPYFTGADRAALTTLTAIGRAIIAKGSIKDVLNYLGLGEGSALPVGVPVPWPTATPPAGWLQCNGATFTKEQYPVLARVYPTLRLPDLRGEFIRGWDDGRKIDEGRKLLSWQKGTLVGGHDDNDSALDISYMSNGNNIDYGGDKVFAGNYRSDYLWYAILGGTNSRAKAELNGAFFNITRPRNIAFNYIVRAA